MRGRGEEREIWGLGMAGAKAFAEIHAFSVLGLGFVVGVQGVPFAAVWTETIVKNWSGMQLR